MTPRLGAYVLPGDPVWLRSSLARYYPLLDDLVVPVPTSGRGWTGHPIPVDECLRIIREIDVRGIVREVEGDWVDTDRPMRADTAQRQAAVDALGERVDWILQVDNDEVLPDTGALLEALGRADAAGCDAVEWPMRVLFRARSRGRFLVVTGPVERTSSNIPVPSLCALERRWLMLVGLLTRASCAWSSEGTRRAFKSHIR
ncbi:hypothetical protein [Janibacter sp. G56]|uniref:hypothetical protein n=1 Tax=Janibacter sp. G56 TaxID=3418717 RepID=UPI003CFC80C2